MFFGIVITAGGLLVISRTVNLGMYYAGFLVMGVGISLITGMIPAVAVARWFRKDLGKATGILAMGVGIGGALAPLVVKYVDHFGWRDSILYSALL
jgi:cyanate permease